MSPTPPSARNYLAGLVERAEMRPPFTGCHCDDCNVARLARDKSERRAELGPHGTGLTPGEIAASVGFIVAFAAFIVLLVGGWQ